MIVGILKEIKTEENRVCMTPAGVEVMIHNGHTVLVEKSAGAGSGFADDAYIKSGARNGRHARKRFSMRPTWSCMSKSPCLPSTT
jgi:alanine dehydrogenase